MELDWTKIIFGAIFLGLIVFAIVRGMSKPSPKKDSSKNVSK